VDPVDTYPGTGAGELDRYDRISKSTEVSK
jgi:hypothetical protein